MLHLSDIDAPPDSGEAPLFVLDLHCLPYLVFFRCQCVERHRDISRDIVHLDGKDIALGDRDSGGRKESRAHANGVLNVLSGGLENLVRDYAWRGLSLDGAEEDEPEQEGNNGADRCEGQEDVNRESHPSDLQSPWCRVALVKKSPVRYDNAGTS